MVGLLHIGYDIHSVARTGDIVCLYFFGRKIIYLNTAEVAFDLLDKRGSIYSDKPRMVMAGELCVLLFLVKWLILEPDTDVDVIEL